MPPGEYSAEPAGGGGKRLLVTVAIVGAAVLVCGMVGAAAWLFTK
jgi:hypothetical protein